MATPRTQLEQATRFCLVIGAILLLVGNLLPGGGNLRFTVLAIGDVLVIVGIIGEGVCFVLRSSRREQQRKRRAGRQSGSKRG
ncbi:hypothetical protein ACSMXN_20095 [Jatrophihabitans sp. DSM 45814]